MPGRNLERRRKYQREYYAKRLSEDPEFKERHAKLVRAYAKKVRDLQQVPINVFRADGCLLCPEKSPFCLDAHHVNPKEKDFNIGTARSRALSVKKLKAELAKCVCLCRNCHAKVHAGVFQLPDNCVPTNQSQS